MNLAWNNSDAVRRTSVVGSFILAITVASLPAEMKFTDITEEAGITYERLIDSRGICGVLCTVTAGGVAEDFDGDGWIDIFLPQWVDGPSHLYMNNMDGTFSEEAAVRNADITGSLVSAAAADYDNDNDIDILVLDGQGPHHLLINNGQGVFQHTRLDEGISKEAPHSASFGDIDNDGDLDILIGQWKVVPPTLTLLRNDDGVLTKLPDDTFDQHHPWTFSPRFADANGDGWIDIMTASDFNNSRIYINDRTGNFLDKTEDSGASIDENGMGCAIGDYDNDGDLDWFVSSIVDPRGQESVIGNRLYRNHGDGTFDDVTEAASVMQGGWGWGSAFGDLDLDGDLDLVHVNGWLEPPFRENASRLFENMGDLTFQEKAADYGVDNKGSGRGFLMADFDNDGDLDLLMLNGAMYGDQSTNQETGESAGRPALYRNDSEELNDNNWLKVSLDAAPPLQPQGIGARVYTTTGDTTMMHEMNASTNYLAQGPHRIAHFGIGTATEADSITVKWNNWVSSTITKVSANQHITIPSPMATVSKRQIVVGETINLDGTTVTGFDGVKNWVIEAENYGASALIQFDTPGERILKFEIRNESTDDLSYREVHTIVVNKSELQGWMTN